MTVPVGEQAAMEIFVGDRPPTAVITGANLQLVGVLHTLQRLGLTVGRDVAVAACDDVPIASLHNPPITVVARDTRQLGREAAGLLLARLAQPQKAFQTLHLPTEVVIRRSTELGTVPAGGGRWTDRQADEQTVSAPGPRFARSE